jgi:hypothetical protein
MGGTVPGEISDSLSVLHEVVSRFSFRHQARARHWDERRNKRAHGSSLRLSAAQTKNVAALKDCRKMRTT